MAHLLRLGLLLLLQCLLCAASVGDRDSSYRHCVQACQQSGCIGEACFTPCTNEAPPADDPQRQGKLRFVQEKLKWDCASECGYQCMNKRELERSSAGEQPVKYHGKWPFARMFGIQEPASVAFSLLNMLVHLWGLATFIRRVYHKLPKKTQGGSGPFYEFAGLWIVYGLISVNCWLWSAVFHSRDVSLTERLDYSSANVYLGYSLILSIVRVFCIVKEEQRVMVAAPIIGFVATHVCFLNFYEFDYGWNIKVGLVMGVTQMLLWLGWAVFSRHPSRLKVAAVVIITAAAVLLEVFDFPPLAGVLDAHSLWHLATIPVSYLWWSFLKEDASFRTQKWVRPKKKSK